MIMFTVVTLNFIVYPSVGWGWPFEMPAFQRDRLPPTEGGGGS